ncbi:MAG: stage V sporulation protein AB [Clostridium sp.]|nr:stage V sporulation protein AB [Clostridium sp.]
MSCLKWILLMTAGFSGGFVTAAAFVAFISMLGIFQKIAAKTKTANECMLYENCLMLGILLATLVQFFLVYNSAGFYSGTLPPSSIGIFILCLIGIFGGIYIGFLIGGLSEILNVIPIFARKAHIQKFICLIIYFIAAGKSLFTLIQFFILRM